MRLIMFVLAVGLTASGALAQYSKVYQAGQTKMRAAKYTEARQDFEQALKLASNAVEQADAQIAIGMTYATGVAEDQHDLACANFKIALAIKGITPAQQVQAQMNIGRCLERDGTYKMHGADRAYTKAIIAYSKFEDIAGASSQQKYEARMAVAGTFMTIKNFSEAAIELKKITQTREFPEAGKAQAQLTLGKCRFYERNYAAARNEFVKALGMKELSNSNKVEAQLYIGLAYYHEQEYERGNQEIQKILTMPGASAAQIREARLRKLIPSDKNFLTVLFIGASQTQVFNVPQIVEALAASAPADSPRIVTDGFLRGGTGIQEFWEEGEGPGTARDRIMTAPWDCVVFETHPLLFGNDIFVKYASNFAELIRACHANPIFLEEPAFIRHSYPAEFQKIHDETMELAKPLKVPVAAANYAWMNYLGQTPTPEQRQALYHPDAVHPSKKGAYMIACSVYSAITGMSPVGLTHSIPAFEPDGLSPEEANALQKAAWEAFLETKKAQAK